MNILEFVNACMPYLTLGQPKLEGEVNDALLLPHSASCCYLLYEVGTQCMPVMSYFL